MNPLPYGRHEITNEDIEAVVSVLKSDFLTQGPAVETFEKKLAEYLGARHVIAVSNGTAALHLAAQALNVDKGEWVVCTPNTFAASSNCVLYCGGDVEFVDIDENNFCLDLSKLQNYLENTKKKVRGIVAVDFAGYPLDFEKLRKIANHHGLWVIEDACHALGAEFLDSHSQWIKAGNGMYADIAVFSFHPVKHIAMGEGGALVTNNDALAARLRLLRSHGIVRSSAGWFQEMRELGYNYRLSDINAALGASQLGRIEKNVQRRREIAAFYDRHFAPPGWVSPRPSTIRHAYHLYILQIPSRDELYDFLRQKGIFAQVHYVPVPSHPYYVQKYGEQHLEKCEEYFRKTLSLPMYPTLDDRQVQYVVETVLQFYGEPCKNNFLEG